MLELFEAALYEVHILTPRVGLTRGALCLLPELARNHGCRHPFVQVSEEVSHLGEVPEAEAVHRLDQFARDALFAQKSGQDDRLVVRLGENA